MSNEDLTNYTRLSESLRSIRQMLNMDVIFVSEFVDNQRTFRYVDARSTSCPVRVGDSAPLEESYCLRVVDGRLPRIIRDASALPAAQEIAATKALGVRAHLSVPIVLHNGKVFGTLCCFSLSSAIDLQPDDEAALQAIADYIAAGIDKRGAFRASIWPESTSGS